ncbi:hypothetical protein KC866_01215 [Patescibacteria group bacterium]|nr:hypothetical protein [Patescibacteria group bacterium]
MEHLLTIVREYILIPHAYAAPSEKFIQLMERINDNVINPIIIILFAAAFVLFTVGLYNLFGNQDNTDAMEKGKRHMVWGVVGMAIMISVFGIMRFITGSIGVSNVNPETQIDASVLVQPSSR